MANLIRVRIDDKDSTSLYTPVRNTDGGYSVSALGFSDRTPGSSLLYDTQTKKYYAEPMSNAIPVILTDKGEQAPTLDKVTGFYTVGRQYYNTKASDGTVFLYDRDNKKMFDPNQTANADYNSKLQGFQQQYFQTKQKAEEYASMVSVRGDGTQVNSLVDVFVNSFNALPGALKKEGFFNWYVNIHGAGIRDYLDDKLVKPLLSKDLTGWDKPKILFNNALIGLGETMDTFSGPIKALVLDGETGWKNYFRSTTEGEGRIHYDFESTAFQDQGAWGGEVLDFLTNVVLETITDPVTWISLGLSAGTSAATESIDDIVIKAVKEAGGEVDAKTVGKLTRRIKRAIKSGDDTVEEAVQRGAMGFVSDDKKWRSFVGDAVGLSKQADDVAKFVATKKGLSEFTENFVKSLNTQVKVFTTTLDYKILSSLKTTKMVSDEVMKGLFKASAFTSALGLGYLPYTLLKFAGPKIIKSYKAWESKSFKDITPKKASMFTAEDVSEAAVLNLKTMFEANDLVLNDELSALVMKDITATLSTNTFDNIQRVLDSPVMPPKEKLLMINEFLTKESSGVVNNIKELAGYIRSSEMYHMYDAGTRHKYNSVINQYNSLFGVMNEQNNFPYLSLVKDIEETVTTLKSYSDALFVEPETGWITTNIKHPQTGNIIDSIEIDNAILQAEGFNTTALTTMSEKLEYPRIAELLELNAALASANADAPINATVYEEFMLELSKLRNHIEREAEDFKILISNTDLPNTSKVSDLAERNTKAPLDAKDLLTEYLATTGLTESQARAASDRVVLGSNLTRNAKEMTRASVYQVSKASSLEHIMSNGTLKNVASEVHHNIDGVGTAINDISKMSYNLKEFPEMSTFTKDVISLRTDFFNYGIAQDVMRDILDSPAIDKTLREGMLDTLAGGDEYFRSILSSENIDFSTVEGVEFAAEILTERLLDGAVEYQTKRTGKYDLQFERMLNTPDPEKNLKNMFDALDSSEFADIKQLLDDDNYTNIYYSVATDSGAGGVYGIAFGTSLDDMYVARNTDIVPAHSYQTAKYSFGMSVEEYHKYYKGFLESAPTHGTEEFYLRAIGEPLNKIKTESAAQGKKIRFIGANNKSDSLKTDMLLNQSLRRFSTRQYLGETEDILQILRRSEGQYTFSDAAYSATKENMIKIINKIKSTPDVSSGLIKEVSLVVDINKNTAMTIKKVADEIRNFLSGKETVLSPTTTPLKTLHRGHLQHTVERFDALQKSIRYTLGDLAGINSAFKRGSSVIDEAELTRVLGYSTPYMNTQRILDIPRLKENGSVALLNLKKEIDVPASSYWFDLDLLGPLKESGTTTLASVWEATSKLERIQNSIVNTPLVGALGVDELRRARNILASLNQTSAVDGDKLFLRAFKEVDTPKQLYTQAFYLYSNTTGASREKAQSLLASKELLDVRLALVLADDYVFDKGFKYVLPSSPVISSSLTAPNSGLRLAKTLSDEIQKIQDGIDDISMAIGMTEHLLSASNASSPALRHRNKQYAELVSPVQKFIDTLDAVNGELLRKYEEAVVRAEGSVIDLEVASRAFSESRRALDQTFEGIGKAHALTVAEIVFQMNPEQLTAHVYKNGLGKLVVDTSSNTVKSMSVDALPKFELMLKDSAKYGIKYEVDERYIKVWFDKTMFPDEVLDQVDTHYRSFTLGDVTPIIVDNLLNTKVPYPELSHGFAQVLKTMGEYMDDGFMLSSYNASTVASFTNLSEMFSSTAKKQSLDLTFLQGKNMLDATFNNSFVGDYGAGSRTVYEFMSPNILTNMMNGVNMVKSKLDYVSDTLNWYFNPSNSFANFVQHTSAMRNRNTSWKEIKKAFEDNGYVIHTLKEDTKGRLIVRELPLDNLKDFEAALKDINATYSTRATMRHLDDVAGYRNISIQEALRNEKYQSKIYKAYKEEIRPLYITGYLSTDPATWVRNYSDGSIKGMLQTQGDPAFIKRLFKVREASKQWDTVRIDIITKKKSLSPDNIHQYFIEEPLLFKGMDEQVFLTMLEIKNHSATSMSQSQLKWYKEPFKVLRSYAPNTVHDLDIKRAIKVFDKHAAEEGLEHVVRQNVLQDLIEEVGEEVAQVLLPLRKYYSTPTHGGVLATKLRNTPIIGDWLNFNAGMFSSVEDDIRMALAMYYVDDLGYNVSMAVDKVVESQFDYGKGKLLSFVENIFPFTTFKAYNIKFWATDAMNYSGALTLMDSILTSSIDGMSEDDVIEGARMHAIRAKIASGDYSFDSQEEKNAWEEYMSDIEGYSGVDSVWAEQNGYVRIFKDGAIKLGNSLLDVVEVFTDPIGTLSNSLFSPIKSIIALQKALKENPEAIPDLLLNEDYAVSGLIPVLGVVYNKIKAGWKNYVASDFYLASVFPGLFGVMKTPDYYRNRPVGYDWYNQSEEYKATHQYVPGVSYVPSWVRKNPASYVDTYGRLQNLGYTKDEAADMMADGWYMNTEYELRNVDDYDNMPKVIMYDRKIYSRTLDTLLSLGWDISKARSLMLEGVYFDEAGQQKQASELERSGKKSTRPRARQFRAKKTYAKKFKFIYPKHISSSSFKSRGYQRIYRVKIDSNTTRNALSLRSSYPAAYRNIKYANRRNMYKNLYARYGTPRMAMRQNQVGYSNPSITRLRRTEIQHNKYRNRRSF